jgi:hypothetical protein
MRALMTFGVVAITLALASLASAYEFQPLGFESISMGGAGVASARGSMAGYYNPALLGRSAYLAEVTPGFGFGIREMNLSDNIDKLDQYDLTNTLNAVANNVLVGNGGPGATVPTNIQNAQQVLQSMAGGQNSLSLMPSASLGVQAMGFGIGIFGTSDGAAQAIIDPNRLALIVHDGGGNYFAYDPATDTYAPSNLATYNATSLEYAINNNLTYLKLTGMGVVEAPISYARKLPIPVGELIVGASVKPMRVTTYEGRINLDTNSDEIDNQLKNFDTTSTSLGIDVGALFTPPAMDNLTLGMVIKNINGPKFDTVSGGEVKIDPMMRAGAAYSLADKKIDIAADLDLTKNERMDGTDAQFLGVGANFHPKSWLSVRAGLMQNLAESDEGTVLTGGFGFGLKWFQLDIAGQMSTKKGEYKGDSIPRYGRVNIALVSRW